jgi:8-oxo-dGTP pyrophosphatase MutT (NUDIX family)
VILDDLDRLLREALRRPLPGFEAQLRMSPRSRQNVAPSTIPATAIPAAGLILIYGTSGPASLVLTVRSSALPHHPGQVSLPGGVIEPGESFAEAALREGQEEIGLDPASIDVIGELTPLFIPVSGFVLHPVVAVRRERPAFVPAADEVERVVEVAVPDLMDPRRSILTIRERDRVGYEVPGFDLPTGDLVWGATAMVLAEMLAMLDYWPDPGQARRASGRGDRP